MHWPDWATEADSTKPSAARAYDYLLGGSHNFDVDRQLADRAAAIMPDIVDAARENRAFLRRAVAVLSAAGVRQFLDIGSGIPTVGNVHEIAQQTDPDARVVYVDLDPVAVAHAQRILTGNPYATIIQADARQPDTILQHPELRAMLDLDQPIALLMMSILPAIVDADDPHGIVARFRDQVAAGSYLALTHAVDEVSREQWAQIVRLSEEMRYPVGTRSRAEIRRFFDGFDLIDPGLVWVPDWRPDDSVQVGAGDARRAGALAGVGRQPTD